jgi:hypothetical protein
MNKISKEVVSYLKIESVVAKMLIDSYIKKNREWRVDR